MAISTYKVFLMEGTGSGTLSYSVLVPITSFPDLMQAPENLETTTLSDGARTYIPGLQEQESMEFGANYDKTTFNTLKGKEGTELNLGVFFGASSMNGQTPTGAGSEGKFTFKGRISVSVVGGGVNEVVGMTVTVTPSTPITFSAS